VKPLTDRGHRHFEIVYANGVERPTVAVEAFVLPPPVGPGERRLLGRGDTLGLDMRVHVRVDARGVTFVARNEEIGPDCRTPGVGPTLAGSPSLDEIRRCALELVGQIDYWPGTREIRSIRERACEQVWIVASPETPFGPVATVIDAVSTARLFHRVSLGYEDPIPANVLAGERALADFRAQRRAIRVKLDRYGPGTGPFERTFALARRRFHRCYQDGIDRDPATHGVLAFSLTVGEDGGRATKVTLRPKPDSRLSPTTTECVRSTLESLDFEPNPPATTIRGDVGLDFIEPSGP
jgi:hypothetical protein